MTNRHPRISIDPDTMVGKPCIKGTRVTVELILRKLGMGLTIEAIRADHPRLSIADIHAAQAYAADVLAAQMKPAA